MFDNKILVPVYDAHIINESKIIAQIVDYAHKNDTVILNCAEGADLSILSCKGQKFLDFLTDLCNKNNWSKNKFHLQSGNLIQNTSVWPVIEKIFLSSLGIQKVQAFKEISLAKKFDKHFGCLINGSSWARFWISAYLFTRHGGKTFQTFRRNLSDPTQSGNIDLDRLIFEFSSFKKNNKANIDTISNFLSALPLEKHQANEVNQVDHFWWDWKGETLEKYKLYNIEALSWYNNFFVDIVCETHCSGQSFFLTEKTIRSIMMMNPFIIFGPADFVKNLKKLGFLSFGNFWDETYDDFSGVLRINALEKLIDDLSSWPLTRILETYDLMQPILEHNRKLLFSCDLTLLLKKNFS